jgi:hypothetical protein
MEILMLFDDFGQQKTKPISSRMKLYLDGITQAIDFPTYPFPSQ